MLFNFLYQINIGREVVAVANFGHAVPQRVTFILPDCGNHERLVVDSGFPVTEGRIVFLDQRFGYHDLVKNISGIAVEKRCVSFVEHFLKRVVNAKLLYFFLFALGTNAFFYTLIIGSVVLTNDCQQLVLAPIEVRYIYIERLCFYIYSLKFNI